MLGFPRHGSFSPVASPYGRGRTRRAASVACGDRLIGGRASIRAVNCTAPHGVVGAWWKASCPGIDGVEAGSARRRLAKLLRRELHESGSPDWSGMKLRLAASTLRDGFAELEARGDTRGAAEDSTRLLQLAHLQDLKMGDLVPGGAKPMGAIGDVRIPRQCRRLAEGLRDTTNFESEEIFAGPGGCHQISMLMEPATERASLHLNFRH